MLKPGMCLGNCGLENSSTKLVPDGSARSAARSLMLTAPVSSSMLTAAVHLARRRNQPAIRRSTLDSVSFSGNCLKFVQPPNKEEEEEKLVLLMVLFLASCVVFILVKLYAAAL